MSALDLIRSTLGIRSTSALLAASILISAPAAAETDSVDISRTEYWAMVHGMPDLDQRRDTSTWGVERNEGRMYCGPTSAANVLSYLVQQGYPGVDAPTEDLEPVEPTDTSGPARLAATVHNRSLDTIANAWLADLADEMGTGAFSWTDYDAMTDVGKMIHQVPLDRDDYNAGTGHSSMIAGLEGRLSRRYDVYSEGNPECVRGSGYTITPRRIFEHLDAGHQLIIHLGYYRDDSDGITSRTGGHYVVVTGVERTADDSFQLWYSDPARTSEDDDASSQGAFVTEVTELSRTTITLPGADGCSRTRWHMVDRGDSYIDALIVVAPPGT